MPQKFTNLLSHMSPILYAIVSQLSNYHRICITHFNLMFWRIFLAGQEQPTNSNNRAAKSRAPKMKQVEKEKPVDFVQESKFALLSVDSDDDKMN